MSAASPSLPDPYVQSTAVRSRSEDADHHKLRFVRWIWHVRGSLPLESGLSRDDAFERLDPLFRQSGTTRDRVADTLVFHKRDQEAQDRMSVFDSGVLRVDEGPSGAILRYHLVSRALLFCFLAPFLFLAFAQLTIAVGDYQKAAAAQAAKMGKAPKKKPEKAVLPLNPIDKALGAPAPEKKKKKDEDKKPSPTPAYVLAGMFAALYVIGRILEDRLIRSLFRKRLAGG